jgi:hypothetical protein
MFITKKINQCDKLYITNFQLCILLGNEKSYRKRSGFSGLGDGGKDEGKEHGEFSGQL